MPARARPSAPRCPSATSPHSTWPAPTEASGQNGKARRVMFSRRSAAVGLPGIRSQGNRGELRRRAHISAFARRGMTELIACWRIGEGGVVMDGVSYPVSFSVDYPDRDLDRMTSFFRIFTVIPVGIVLGAVAGGTWQWTYGHGAAGAAAGAGGLLFFGPRLLILFRQKYPRSWFDWNLELQR